MNIKFLIISQTKINRLYFIMFTYEHIVEFQVFFSDS